MKLPTEKTEPSTDPMQYSILLYGPTKVGKTTFASHADGALFLCTEPGTTALSVYKIDIATWEDLLRACKLVVDGGHSFKTIVIDTVDNAYMMCASHICAANGWTHPSDGDYGKGFAAVNNEFRRFLLKLAGLPYGLVLISHSQEKEVKPKTGGTYNRITTTLPGGAAKIVIGLCDMVLLCEVRHKRDDAGNVTYSRIMRTKPTPIYDAGDRTGKLPDVIPLDYNAFTAAFAAATQKEKGKGKK
jgi:hypothetical protein